MRRRRLLATLSTATLLAGCTGDDPPNRGAGDDGEPTEDAEGTDDPSTPAASLPDHPALADIDAEPAVGPPPGEAPATVVAFEDPSCPTCRRWEERTWPRLESELVATGRLTFVYRVYPIVYPWGEPASQALEATYAAAVAAGDGPDAPAFWRLKTHYYAEQASFDGDNVLDRTEAFLASETDLDAAAVVTAARERRHDDRVQADLAAGEAAGVGSTPTFFLFRDGAFRTRVRGAQAYGVFASALGL